MIHLSMINPERITERSYTRPRRLPEPHGSSTRITAHFWVGDQRYEVDYDKAARADGAVALLRREGSERRCQCAGRDVAERRRRDRDWWRAADGYSPGLLLVPVGAEGR